MLKFKVGDCLMKLLNIWIRCMVGCGSCAGLCDTYIQIIMVWNVTNFSDILLMSIDRSISSNLGQKAWVEPWLPLGQVHVYKYMFTINILKLIIKKN